MVVKVEAYHDGSFWCARELREDFFTQRRTLDELVKNVREAASLHSENVLKRGENLNILLMSETEGCQGCRRLAPGTSNSFARPVAQ